MIGEYIDSAGNLHIVSTGDGCTAMQGWVWVSSQRREDGLYEHVFRRDDGK